MGCAHSSSTRVWAEDTPGQAPAAPAGKAGTDQPPPELASSIKALPVGAGKEPRHKAKTQVSFQRVPEVRAFAATRLDDYPEEGEGHEADRDTARTNKSSVDDDGAQSSGRSLLSCLLTDGLAGNPNAGMSFASMRSLNRSQNLSRSLGDLVDLKSGTLTAEVSRNLSTISNCNMYTGEGNDEGTVLLTDEVTGMSVRILQQIGKGGYGRVFLGQYGEQQVAVKAVFGERRLGVRGEDDVEVELQERRERMVQLEALLMSLLSGHPNIVQTYKCLASWRDLQGQGAGQVQGPLGTVQYEWFIIMEYCVYGSLWDALLKGSLHKDAEGHHSYHRLANSSGRRDGTADQGGAAATDGEHASAQGPPAITGSMMQWDAWSCLEILKEVARGLQFLHDNGIVHGDIKAANVLLAESDKDRRGYEAKITDFGFSRVISSTSHVHTKTFGTVTHQPPELLSSGLLTPAADVYGFAMVMWEVYMAQGLFKELSDSEVIIHVIRDRCRPAFPAGCPACFRQLAERCWDELPESRPSMQEVEEQLTAVQAELCAGQEQEPWLIVGGTAPARRRTRRRPPPETENSNTPQPPPPVPKDS